MGRNSGALLARAVSVASLANIPKNRAQFPKRSRNFGTPRYLGPGFPRTRLCAARCVFLEPAREFFENAFPVALASSFAGERAVEHRLEADQQEHAQHLHLK